MASIYFAVYQPPAVRRSRRLTIDESFSYSFMAFLSPRRFLQGHRRGFSRLVPCIAFRFSPGQFTRQHIPNITRLPEC